MPEGDPFEAWLSDFRKDVDASLDKAPAPALSTPEGRQAREAFDRWWSSEQQPMTEPRPRLDAGLLDLEPAPKAEPPAARESVLAHEWPLRLERLAEERAKLQDRAERAEQETAALRERLAGVTAEIAALEAKLSRARERYEDHIARLEEQARGEAAHRAERARSEEALQAAAKRALDEQAALRSELALEKARADAADKKGLELRRALEDERARRAEQEKAAAAQEGALGELRRQASVYSQRLVQSKEVTDSDIMTMRQDLKTFLEELRLLRNSIRKGE